MLPRDVTEGDVLLALPSSGPHSNGYSLIRKIVAKSGLTWDAPAPFAQCSLGEALLEPTKIYVQELNPLLTNPALKGLAHITGGGLTENIPRMLPEGCAVEINLAAWTLPPVFAWLQANGQMSEAEMLKTFNCGVGMVMAVAPEAAEEIAKESGAFVLGQITAGEGVSYKESLK